MRTSEFIREGLGHIQKGWCQGSYEDGEGNVCGIAALDRVSLAHLHDGGIQCHERAKQKVLKKLRELFADDNTFSIPGFNDRHDTTQEDMEAAFHKAALEAEEEGD